MDPVVELTNVSKRFGQNTVIDDVSMAVPSGQIFGLIGPSGCGKSTIVRLLVGVLAPSSGTVRVMGTEPERFSIKDRERIGYTPQGFVLYPTLTVAENANFVAALYGMGWLRRRRRVREVLRFLEIWDARKRMARDISGGMQRRLMLACALAHDPALLLVDEPTAGLDPVLRAKVWEHLRTLRDQGKTVVVTTQYLDEAEYCDTVAILNEGRLAAVGSPDDLRARSMGGDLLDVEARNVTREAIGALWQLAGVHSVEPRGSDGLHLRVTDVATVSPAITESLYEHGVDVVAVHPHVPTFDEVFLKIVGADV